MAAQPRRGDADRPFGILVTDFGPVDNNVSALAVVRRDLKDEQDALDDIVSDLTDDQWRTDTPSAGWTVADQIGHLAYFDAAAALAISDPRAFQVKVGELVGDALDVGLDQFTLGAFRAKSPSELLAAWRHDRRVLVAAATALDDHARVEWFGPSMGAKSFLSARLMEAWAHGTDVTDALHVSHPATNRILHVARLGFATRRWSYAVRGEVSPTGSIRVELIGPANESWTFGDADADETVSGSAEEFCLVVTQRRHLDDTALQTGPLGRHWLLRAQVFAGGPTLAPPSGSSRASR